MSVIPDPTSKPGTYDIHLYRVYTWATASDATADDLDGAGRVVGNLLTQGGEHILALCTRISLMLGGGPNAPLRMLLKSLRCKQCMNPYFGIKSGWLPRHASADFILRELFIRSIACASCHSKKCFTASGQQKSSKADKAFTKIFRGYNTSSQYSAILYIVALASLVPDLRACFVKNDAARALAALRSRVTQRPDEDFDFLLAPSHRALVVLGELEIHSVGKEIVVLTESVPEAETWEHFEELTRRRSESYDVLYASWNSSIATIFIAVIIRAGVRGNEFDFISVACDKWPAYSFCEERWTDTFKPSYTRLALHLAHSQDPVLKSMLPALLFALRESTVAYYRPRIQYNIAKGRTPRKGPRTLAILQGSDWERFLRSWYGLIDRDDEQFIEYALEDWDDDYENDEGTCGTSAGEDL